jgi:prolyl oligopeptidase
MNNIFIISILSLSMLVACTGKTGEKTVKDNYLWLEEIQGEKPKAFAEKRSRASLEFFQKDTKFNQTEKDILNILDDEGKIPYASIKGEWVYNFWKDEKSVRGLYRRMLLNDYRKGSESWETVFDLDLISKNEGENWVLKGVDFEDSQNKRALLTLSRGGKDASVVREFDIEKKQFVKDGFITIEGKTSLNWLNENQIIAGVTLKGETPTKGGYFRKLRLWNRGEKIEESKVLFEMGEDKQFTWPWIRNKDQKVWIMMAPEGYKTIFYHLDLTTFKTTKLPLHQDISLSGEKEGDLFFKALKDLELGGISYKSGDIFYMSENSLIEKGKVESKLLIRPKAHQTLNYFMITKSRILADFMEDVKTKILEFRKTDKGYQESHFPVPDPDSKVSIYSYDDERDDFFLIQEGFLRPESLYYFSPKKKKFEFLKEGKKYFNADNLKVEQHFATSKDGTKVPYFQVSKKDLKLDGSHPTLQYGYGGFNHSMLPFYSKVQGRYWLEKGGVYVLTNIRGGDEYGPRWHQSALKLNRHKSYEDFFAISEDLIARKVTSPKKLAIMGGSNGGLLMGVAFTQRPELYASVICNVPLLDMERYHKLLAGHLWIGEYGSVDQKEMRDYLLSYSPYHNVKSLKKTRYPEIFFYTSTLDDRVHPGHARKMVAKMEDLGHKVYYYENMEGGHAGASNNKHVAKKLAMQYSFLYLTLGLNH